MFCSSSLDRKINVWDLSRCGAEIQNEEEEDGPPELLFVHGGHRSRVNDLNWNKNDNHVICSVEDGNIL